MLEADSVERVLEGDTMRLFDGYDAASLAAHPVFVVGKLLEEGDGTDLRKLTAAVPERYLAHWLERHGARKLTDRARVFWRLVLGVQPHDEDGGSSGALGAEIWPL